MIIAQGAADIVKFVAPNPVTEVHSADNIDTCEIR